jgi:hypothetical protein
MLPAFSLFTTAPPRIFDRLIRIRALELFENAVASRRWWSESEREAATWAVEEGLRSVQQAVADAKAKHTQELVAVAALRSAHAAAVATAERTAKARDTAVVFAEIPVSAAPIPDPVRSLVEAACANVVRRAGAEALLAKLRAREAAEAAEVRAIELARRERAVAARVARAQQPDAPFTARGPSHIAREANVKPAITLEAAAKRTVAKELGRSAERAHLSALKQAESKRVEEAMQRADMRRLGDAIGRGL